MACRVEFVTLTLQTAAQFRQYGGKLLQHHSLAVVALNGAEQAFLSGLRYATVFTKRRT